MSAHFHGGKKAVAATCTMDGYTGDTYCVDCGKLLLEGTTIAAKGHTWNSGMVTTDATVTSNGVKTYTCSVCGATKTESIAKLTVQYTVKFNGNGNTSGSMSSQTITYGSGTKLTANAYKRTGYTFKGWNTKADGSGTSYSNKADGSKLRTSAGTVTLYAQWKKASYTITYNLNGGKNNSSNPAFYTITTATISLKNPTKTGYDFAGWYSDKKCTKKVTQIKRAAPETRLFMQNGRHINIP